MKLFRQKARSNLNAPVAHILPGRKACMNQKDLKPASQLAQRFGVKAVCFGGPGSGKTPLLTTAPRPILCAVEPGLLSMRNSNIPTWEAYTRPKLEEFFAWFFTSSEAKQYDTLGIDSISQLAEIILTDELNPKKNKDGRAAYGKLSIAVMELANTLYYLPQKHIFLIAKQTIEDGTGKKKPYFPGQDLNVKVPHMYDEVLHLGLHSVPGMVQPVRSIQTRENFEIFARDRSGNLDEFEPPDLAALFAKAMRN